MSGEGSTPRALNVFSRGFDPLAALGTPALVPLPAPDARLCVLPSMVLLILPVAVEISGQESSWSVEQVQ